MISFGITYRKGKKDASWINFAVKEKLEETAALRTSHEERFEAAKAEVRLEN